MGSLVIVGIIALIVILYVLSGFTITPQSETKVIERLGKYNRTLNSGINFVLPILDKARVVCNRYEIEYEDRKISLQDPKIAKQFGTYYDLFNKYKRVHRENDQPPFLA